MKRGPQKILRSQTLDAAALAYLQQRPLAHELLLGLWEQQPLGHASAWWTVRSGSAVLGLASFRPPTSLIFSKMSDEALRALAVALQPFARGVQAIHAPIEARTLLGELLISGAPEQSEVLALTRAPDAGPGGGELLLVSEGERSWVRSQLQACLHEISPRPLQPSTVSYWAQCDMIYLWRNAAGESVALTCQNRRHDWGSCLGLIYTLPEHRQRGYAKAMISRVCAHLFEQGHPAVFLHVQSKEVAARSLYRALGFEVVQGLASWRV